jgi:molybdenum cofactor cytidylyltransferase
MGEIRAIILAAGESKRMGFPKMLLDFNGKSMLESVIENVSASDVNHILVVLGAERDKLTELVRNMNVSYCYNEHYKKGMLSSVRCGVENTPGDCDAVLVFQGDQPFISPEVINTVIEAYRLSGKGLVIPVCKKKRGHPLLISRKYLEKIALLDDHEGLRSLAYLYSDDVLEVETDDQTILRDFDTYEEYKKEINQIL